MLTLLKFLWTVGLSITFSGPLRAQTETVNNSYLRVDPLKNGVELKGPAINWKTTGLNEIIFGNFSISENNFQIRYPDSLDVKQATKSDLVFQFPKSWAGKIKFSFFSQDGALLFDEDAEFESGTHSPELRLIESNFNKLVEFLVSSPKSNFKVCAEHATDQFTLVACSPPYRYLVNKHEMRMAQSIQEARALVNKAPLSEDGSMLVKGNQDLEVFLSSKDGYTLNFKTKAPQLNIVDYYQAAEKPCIQVIGYGGPPANNEYANLSPEKELQQSQWDKTIGDLKKYWISCLPINEPVIVLRDSLGFEYRYDLTFRKIPQENERIYLLPPQYTTTYAENIRLMLSSADKKHMRSDGSAITYASEEQPSDLASNVATETTDKPVYWDFHLPNQGESTSNEITLVNHSQEKFFLSHSIYRSYSQELSFRLGGILSADFQLAALSEVSYGKWFEDILDLNNYYLSKQRWGVSFRALSQLTSISVGGDFEERLRLLLTTLNLNYRLTPGVWERDETLGVIFGLQTIQFNSVRRGLLGLGVLWTRSMPKVFDQLYNLVPFMRYPKWVDMDFIVYPVSTDSAGNSNSIAYSLDFHGKVLWKKDFYGEAGFGYKGFQVFQNGLKGEFATFYGIAGLGLNF